MPNVPGMTRGLARNESSLPQYQAPDDADLKDKKDELFGIFGFLTNSVTRFLEQDRWKRSPNTGYWSFEGVDERGNARQVVVPELVPEWMPARRIDSELASEPLHDAMAEAASVAERTLKDSSRRVANFLSRDHAKTVARAAELLDLLPTEAVSRRTYPARPMPSFSEQELYDLVFDQASQTWRQSDPNLITGGILLGHQVEFDRAHEAVEQALTRLYKDDPHVTYDEAIAVLRNSSSLIVEVASLNSTQSAVIGGYTSDLDNHVYNRERQRVEYRDNLLDLVVEVSVDQLPSHMRPNPEPDGSYAMFPDGLVDVPVRLLVEDERGIASDMEGCPARLSLGDGVKPAIPMQWDAVVRSLEETLRELFPAARVENPPALDATRDTDVEVRIEGVTRPLSIRAGGTDRPPVVDGSIDGLSFEWNEVQNVLTIGETDVDAGRGPAVVFLPRPELVRVRGSVDVEVLGATNLEAEVDGGTLRAVVANADVDAIGASTVHLITAGDARLTAHERDGQIPSGVVVERIRRDEMHASSNTVQLIGGDATRRIAAMNTSGWRYENSPVIDPQVAADFLATMPWRCVMSDVPPPLARAVEQAQNMTAAPASGHSSENVAEETTTHASTQSEQQPQVDDDAGSVDPPSASATQVPRGAQRARLRPVHGDASPGPTQDAHTLFGLDPASDVDAHTDARREPGPHGGRSMFD